MPRAVALYSGGLDSTLAILVMKRLGVDVTAITFLTHFGCDISDKSSCSKDPFAASVKFGFDVKLSHLADKFIEIVKKPKYGHGKNMNPCIDCRILMLREARDLMKMLGADFIITGEVLGQRPMSQRRETFPLIDREAGTEGLVLRPLCAKLLTPTLAENSGLVDRDRLYDFNGRSRKPQMALANELGLTEYPSPAGGCLLTDPIYSARLRSLLASNHDPDSNDLGLLRLGRHFRLNSGAWLVVGRNKEENDAIESMGGSEDIFLWIEGHGSPLALLRKSLSSEDIVEAAAICARYSDGRHLPEVTAAYIHGPHDWDKPPIKLAVRPCNDDIVNGLRIGIRGSRGKKQPV